MTDVRSFLIITSHHTDTPSPETCGGTADSTTAISPSDARSNAHAVRIMAISVKVYFYTLPLSRRCSILTRVPCVKNENRRGGVFKFPVLTVIHYCIITRENVQTNQQYMINNK